MEAIAAPCLRRLQKRTAAAGAARELLRLRRPRCRPPGRGRPRAPQLRPKAGRRARQDPTGSCALSSPPPFSPSAQCLPETTASAGRPASPRRSAGVDPRDPAERCGPGRGTPGSRGAPARRLRASPRSAEARGCRDGTAGWERGGPAAPEGQRRVPARAAAAAGTARAPGYGRPGRLPRASAPVSPLPLDPGPLPSNCHRGGTRARGHSSGPGPDHPPGPVPASSPSHSAIARAPAPAQPEAAAAPVGPVRPGRASSTCRGGLSGRSCALRAAPAPPPSAAPSPRHRRSALPCRLARRAACRRGARSAALLALGPAREIPRQALRGDGSSARLHLFSRSPPPPGSGKGAAQPGSRSPASGSAERPRHQALAVGESRLNRPL